MPKLVLNQDVGHRWNSTFLMVNRIYDQIGPINRVSNDFSSNYAEYCIQEKDSGILKDIIDVLGIFYDETLEFSATKYATISIVLPVFYNLKYKLKFHSTDSSFKKFLKSILNSSLNFYFDQYQM